MAIDFSNRNPQDKDAVYSVRPAQQTAWIETSADGSWTGKFSSTKPKNTSGWHEVGYATVTLNDGRQFRAVLDGEGKPISEIGDTIGTDDDRARSWGQTGPKPLPSGGSPTQNRNGRVYGYNSQTGLYDIDQGATPQIKPTNVYIGQNPSTGKPSQISEYPDPSAPGGVRREYDDTQVPAAAAGDAKPPEQKDEGGRRYVWKPNPGGPSAGGQWVDAGSAPETPAERQAREANAPTQTVAVRKGGDGRDYTVITIVPKPGQPGAPGQIVIGPDGKQAAGGIPGEPPKEKKEPVKGPDGKTYIRVTVEKPDGTVDLYHTDQNGTRTTLPNAAPDNPTVAGPKVPNFVLEGSVEALTQYKKQLQDGVAAGQWSQKWADDRWGEAYQVAQFATNQHTIQEREREANLNAATNLATTKLTTLQTGQDNALKFVSSLNGLLPEGSPLGGQAFAALLGLNMLNMQMSGINNIRPGAATPAAPVLTPADLSSPEKLEAKRAEIMANPVFRPQPMAPAPGASASQPNAIGVGRIGTTPAPGATAQPSTAPVVPATPTISPNTPAEPPARANIPPAVPYNPAAAAPGAPPLMKPGAIETGPAAPEQNPGGQVLPPPQDTAPIFPMPPGAAPPVGGGGGNVMQEPSIAGEFAALSPFRPQGAAPQQPQADAGPNVALMRAKIAQTPPWQLDPTELEWAEQNGFGDEAWSVPGRRTA